MSDQIRAAAELIVNWMVTPNVDDACHNMPSPVFYASYNVARAYLADLSAREAEQAERGKQVTAEWLESIGFTPYDVANALSPVLGIRSAWHALEIHEGRIILAHQRASTAMVIGTLATTTRGMMLDFLSGLKIETKGTK